MILIQYNQGNNKVTIKKKCMTIGIACVNLIQHYPNIINTITAYNKKG